jgi:phosphatidylinositol alpha-mannosyltransferase
MRVALVCPYSWSRPGGVQTHVAGLARALGRAGHEADVLAPWDGAGEPPGIVPLGRSFPIPDNGSVQRVALGPLAPRRTAARVRRGYDLVHVHEPMIPWTALAAVYAARAPVVGTFHMVASSARWYRVFGLVCRHATARLAARIAVSEAARDYVASAVGGEYAVIPNGIEPPSRVRGTGGGGIVFVGRPEPRKGLAVLLEAFARLEGARLTLVGVTPDEVNGAVPGVRAVGRVSDAERERLLAEADVLCAPSLGRESFGLVLLEAMAAGVPVVASAIPGYAELLPPQCGRLVPPGDAAALTAALAGVLADRAGRLRMGEAGRRHAERFHWDALVPRVLCVYEEAAARRVRAMPQPERAR